MKMLRVLILFAIILIAFGCDNKTTEPSNNDDGELVAYYPLNGDAGDESGYGNDGTIDGAILTNDRFNNPNSAYEFDGVDDVLSVNDFHLWEEEISLSMWVKINSYDSGSNPLYEKHDEIGFHINDGDSVHFYLKDIGSLKSSQIPAIGSWSLLVATYDGTTMKIYKDNELVSEDNKSGIIPDSNYLLYLASDESAIHNYLDASIDDVRIYNYAITENEIDQLYHEGGWDE